MQTIAINISSAIYQSCQSAMTPSGQTHTYADEQATLKHNASGPFYWIGRGIRIVVLYQLHLLDENYGTFSII